jgi:hypothetical protein
MSDRDRPKTPAPPAPPASQPAASGRVQFDDRGQAVWEWSVKTGMFDRNASTQRIKKLLDQPNAELSIVDYDAPAADRAATAPEHAHTFPARGAPPAVTGAPTSPAKGAPGARSGTAVAAKPAALPDRSGGFNPYERAQVERPKAKPGESPGGDPYSRGPAKKPENVSFNPYDRTPRK